MPPVQDRPTLAPGIVMSDQVVKGAQIVEDLGSQPMSETGAEPVPGGSITVLGAGDSATAESGQTVSIVGGTGAYRLARGTVTAQRTKLGPDEGTKFTFEVFTR